MAATRWDGASWVDATGTKRRWDGVNWIDLGFGRRWNGTNWIELWGPNVGSVVGTGAGSYFVFNDDEATAGGLTDGGSDTFNVTNSTQVF
jgi:hypothetical protein